MDTCVFVVTPFVGVWIETSQTGNHVSKMGVTPFVGVWIETYVILKTFILRLVTPFVGVWIETIGLYKAADLELVTPFVGVWIETCPLLSPNLVCMSHPSWVCGLKLRGSRTICTPYCVTPFVGVWIETYNIFMTFAGLPASHTLRGCVD